ncbi:MAG TPA: phospholipase D-like domain-containing protein [Arenicellales bacterium]|nr:phospholipase D-like domain-containing protein [Arenicellales bacterium]
MLIVASDWLHAFWPLVLAVLSLVVSAGTSVHILTRRHDPRGVLAWIGLIWLVPIGGALLYVMFGVNRIERRARHLRGHAPSGAGPAARAARHTALPAGDHWRELRTLMDRVNDMPLLPGNRIDMLRNGDQGYPVMLDAIQGARRSIGLCTFILGNDEWGNRFLDALTDAMGRGVAVRVLVDGAGQYYTFPPIGRNLRRRGIPGALFLHSLLPWRMPYLNLRNHRKILAIDGNLAFTGGMNISAKHAGSPPAARDVHFKVSGPVVSQMVRVFAEDWAFTTGERLDGPDWFPQLVETGRALARGIPDGPDEDFDKCRWAFLAGLGAARRRILVATPYFLPDDDLLTALRHAALRGVRVDILLPGKNNWPFVQWAANTLLERLLAAGCRIWFSSGTFDHGKYLVVDGAWCLLGSANWDPRSLRLNFEFNLEAFDPALSAELERHAETVIASARPLKANDLASRSLPVRVRDGLAMLMSPYL